MIQSRHRLFVPGLDKKAVNVCDEVITCRALDRKRADQMLVVAQHLLDDHVSVGKGRPHAAEVAFRISQSIDVIEAKPGYAPVGEELENDAVAVIQHLLQLDVQADQGVDSEEAPVVELFLSRAPVGEPVVLFLKKCIKSIPVLADGVDVESVEALARDGKFQLVIAHDDLVALAIQGQASRLELTAVAVS